MRALILSVSILALGLSACGKKPDLALSDDPVTRAAQCGVVATAGARLAQTDVRAPVPFETRARVLHYALLTGTTAPGFDADKAGAVLKALPAAEPAITGGKWQPLGTACDAAYPETTAPARLPASSLDAQLGCSLLADYVETALRTQESTYTKDLDPIHKMRLGLDNSIGAKLARAGKKDGEDQKASRDKAMNAIAHAGAASEVLAACVKRYPPAES
ncbi:hypothetical protein [Sphingomonas quercus]|uniref:Lipoprotein n=1 Tax=Sphingomonas quercus TaxID=2842451 RepID=A0ABS6BLK6_9SPHN|nr:hypothetical protein [Sphingomonas quercus]MBU3079190.1 hypothetical protein [Sphingomonas quercus]